MNDNTFVRIKVPKALYESALRKALLEAGKEPIVKGPGAKKGAEVDYKAKAKAKAVGKDKEPITKKPGAKKGAEVDYKTKAKVQPLKENLEQMLFSQAGILTSLPLIVSAFMGFGYKAAKAEVIKAVKDAQQKQRDAGTPEDQIFPMPDDKTIRKLALRSLTSSADKAAGNDTPGQGIGGNR